MPSVSFAHLTRDALDRQFSPSRSAKDPWGVLARHETATAALCHAGGLTIWRDVAYADRPGARVDLFVPAGDDVHPCVIYFHGGFWQEGRKDGSGFAAPVLAEHDRALAAVGYTLAPEARLREIVGEAAAVVVRLHQDAASYGLDPARLVVAGHSAGAHLAAALLAGQGGEAAAAAIAGAVLVSGVYDLAPVAASYVNDRVQMDADEVRDFSPLATVPGRDVPVHVLVGADEPDAFVQQSAALVEAWRPRLSRLTTHTAPGRDHFDVLDELTNPTSPAFLALLEMTS